MVTRKINKFTMRLLIICVLLLVVVISFADAKKRGKKSDREWGKHKKFKKDNGKSKWKVKKFNTYGRNVDENNAHEYINDKEDRGKHGKSFFPKSKNKNFDDSKMYKKEKWFHKFLKKHHGLKKKKWLKKQMKDTSWLQVKKGEADCGQAQCKYGEVCVSSNFDKKPLCVHKQDFKKSMKLFHRYHKKEMKAMRKAKKGNLAADFEWLMDQKKHGSMHKKEDLMTLKKAYLDKYGHGHLVDEYSKQEKKYPMEEEEPKAEKEDECSTGQFSQMRMRMMGWFHLLHGQDHLARKAHGGGIKKFYKHVSVKKELREFDGQKCECLKSAMWQFNQLDEEGDDQLTEMELAMLIEDSLEPCIKPYLASCDINADKIISSDEWCCCFSNVETPCFRKIAEIHADDDAPSYIPRCDKEGYFMKEQCSTSPEGQRNCWCVDYNGNEIYGSSTPGSAHCAKNAIDEKKKEIDMDE